MLYVFTRPDQMVDHRFSDDVAIVKAVTKRQAVRRFSVLYADIRPSEVRRIKPRRTAYVLTDY